MLGEMKTSREEVCTQGEEHKEEGGLEAKWRLI